jgi:hypothetical protein
MQSASIMQTASITHFPSITPVAGEQPSLFPAGPPRCDDEADNEDHAERYERHSGHSPSSSDTSTASSSTPHDHVTGEGGMIALRDRRGLHDRRVTG